MRKILTVLLVFIFSALFSQNTVEEISEYTSKVYGTDDLLVNGSNYLPLHPVAYGDPCFEKSAFVIGSLYLIGREFENVELKYDIEQQKVILKGFVDAIHYKVIVLNDNYIKDFYLHNKHFVNISNYLNQNFIYGFYELIYDGSFVFVKQYSKEYLAVYSNRYPSGKYSETKIEMSVIKDNIKYKIKNRKSLFSVFPEQTSEIKIYMKDNKIKLRKASNINLYNLMQYCDEVSNQ